MTETQSENSWYFSYNNLAGEFAAVEPDGTMHCLEVNSHGDPKTTGVKFVRLFNRMIQDLSKS